MFAKPSAVACLTSLKRGTAAAAPQVALTLRTSAPVISKKFYAADALQQSLRDPFREMPATWPTTPNSLDKFQTSTTDGGLQVATIDVDVPMASVGLYVKAGPRFETGDVRGASHFLKHLAFTRTTSRSPITVCREMEAATASFGAFLSRENLSYVGQMTHDNVADFVWMLRDLMHPLAWEYIIRDLTPQVEAELLEAKLNPSASFVEAVHREAYRDEGLGHSVYCPSWKIGAITREQIARFHQQRYKLSNMALVGFGVKHETLVAHAQKFFPADTFEGEKAPAATVSAEDLAQVRISEPRPSKYTGGELRIPGPQNTRVGLAFEGAKNGDKDLFALHTLTSLLGGGVRYSADGPGRGVESRLFRNLVGKADFVHAASAFNAPYSDSGLWGVYAEAEPGNAAKVTEMLLTELAGAKNVDDAELTRARNQAKVAFLNGVETRNALVDYVARNVLSGVTPLTPAQYSQAIDKVSKEDVARVAKKVLATEPTFVCTGDVHGLPNKDRIRSGLSA